MEVHLLARIVLVNILAIPGNLVRGVLHAVDTSSDWMLSHPDRVSQTPPKAETSCVELVCLTSHVGKVESSDLAVTRGYTSSCKIDIGRAPSADQEHSGSLLRQEQCPCGVIISRHVCYKQRLTRD